jgi:hypothetical protein
VLVDPEIQVEAGAGDALRGLGRGGDDVDQLGQRPAVKRRRCRARAGHLKITATRRMGM